MQAKQAGSTTRLGAIKLAGFYGMMPPLRGCPAPHTAPVARVVKLVDTGDLKSPAYCRRTGSIPVPGTIDCRIKIIHK